MQNPTDVLAHFEQYQSNAALVSRIEDDWVDWRMTVRFYAALHILSAYHRGCGGSTVRSHEERFYALRNSPFLHAVKHPYGQLYFLSRLARYDCYGIEDLVDLEPQSIAHFDQIEAFALPTVKLWLA